jgi:sterol desaturase/sphingolipid hydroxylase (fatty acid hydroxylase superfamily)
MWYSLWGMVCVVTGLSYAMAAHPSPVSFLHQVHHVLAACLLGTLVSGYAWYDAPVDSWVEWRRFLLLLPWIVVATDVIFWTLHRLLHTPLLYHYIHYQHHLYRRPDAWSTLYAHPVEILLVNGVIVMWPAWLHQLAPTCILTWAALAFINSMWSHTLTEGHHITHHQRMDVNYGLDLFMDRVLGTTVSHEREEK